MTVAVLTNACRRFDQCLSPFWLMVVAVLTWVVAVLTTVVAVLECRRSGLVAIMTGTQYYICNTHNFTCNYLQWVYKTLIRWNYMQFLRIFKGGSRRGATDVQRGASLLRERRGPGSSGHRHPSHRLRHRGYVRQVCAGVRGRRL